MSVVRGPVSEARYINHSIVEKGRSGCKPEGARNKRCASAGISPPGHSGARRGKHRASILSQARIIPHDQVAIDFLNQVERDTNDDEQPSAPVETGHAIIDFETG